MSSGSARARAAVAAIVMLPALLWPAAALAQFPAELAGRVVQAGSLHPIGGAIVEIDAAAVASTDASGSFEVRGVGAGRVRVSIRAAAHASLDTTLVLTNGRTTRLVAALAAVPLEMEPLEVIASRAPAGGHVMTRESIDASGARTLDELVRGVPGVTVRGGAGGGARVSIRGSAADAVLVLVDGAPANDPVTGEADLSTIGLDDVETVRVLPGARSARYGPRAAAGVILVVSRRASTTRGGLTARAGSFGERELEAGAGALLHAITVNAAARFSERHDRFDYALPDGLGGGSATRENAATRSAGGSASLGLAVAGEPLRLRVEALDIERGLPGPIHAPSPHARHGLSRVALSADWHGTSETGALRIDATASRQRAAFEDPAPPFGAAYADATRIAEASARVDAERRGGGALQRYVAAGAELHTLRLASTSLDPRVVRRTDLGVLARGRLAFTRLRVAPEISVAVRADRWSGHWIVSHDLTAAATLGRVALSASHRSAFSPPAASDQFFRAGFAIAPNPDLEPERVPAEIELGISAALLPAGVPLEIGVNAFRGDIDGMIVWAPDHRFVWSPRNRDVLRSGGEAWLRLTPAASLEIGAWASAARVIYDWPGDADTVQVAYRPRYSGGATLDWHPGAWHAGVAARYTGVRYATPGKANPLAAYWDVDVALERTWRIAPVLLTASLTVERVLDHRESFINGYPEPGRRLRLGLESAFDATRIGIGES